MLATRRQGFAERLPRVVAGERGVQLERLRGVYATEVKILERVEREEDAAALADARELLLRDRLERVRAGIERLDDPAQREAAREKYRRMRGVLAWDLSSRYSERLWERKKALRETGRLIAEAETRREALQRAQARMPERFAEFDRRIDSLSVRVGRLRAEVDAAAREEGRHLAEVAAAELTRRRDQVTSLIAQARFAVAQIYDQSLAAQGKAP